MEKIVATESAGNPPRPTPDERRSGVAWPAQSLNCSYSFALLGRFAARSAAGDWPQMEGRRLQQIVAYLLLFGDRPHHRDVLSATLWTESDPKQSRKNLRQSIWQLQKLPEKAGRSTPLLLTEKDWIQIDPAVVWLDVAQLERSYDRVRTVAPEQIGESEAQVLMNAADLYQGDLLAGWDEDWCVRERERLRALYVSLLEKLVGWCEATNRLEAGLAYGHILLEHDRAHERAHRRVMRLHHLSGNRTGALRQFEKCRTALDEELGVEPGRLTRSLYEEICSSG
ncbi:MAG TPA: bacterial transcriptional activator domain-containing protein [Actinomycetota bacterium]|nr:bacterial transcriptional activator domain-containing protein [Actinomycetota bacterium]